MMTAMFSETPDQWTLDLFISVNTMRSFGVFESTIVNKITIIRPSKGVYSFYMRHCYHSRQQYVAMRLVNQHFHSYANLDLHSPCFIRESCFVRTFI